MRTAASVEPSMRLRAPGFPVFRGFVYWQDFTSDWRRAQALVMEGSVESMNRFQLVGGEITVLVRRICPQEPRGYFSRSEERQKGSFGSLVRFPRAASKCEVSQNLFGRWTNTQFTALYLHFYISD